jgi:hypothetical protein
VSKFAYNMWTYTIYANFYVVAPFAAAFIEMIK